MSGSNAAESGAFGTESLPPNTAGQPDFETQIAQLMKERDEWRNRATGWSGTYQREQGKWKETETKVSDLSAQIATLMEQVNTHKGVADAASGSVSYYASALEIANLQLSRQSILINEFPELLSFEAEGLLPEGTGDDLKIKLKKFKEKVVQNGKVNLQTYVQGGTPPAPGSANASTPEELRKGYQAALKSGDRAEYERLYSQYLATPRS